VTPTRPASPSRRRLLAAAAECAGVDAAVLLMYAFVPLRLRSEPGVLLPLVAIVAGLGALLAWQVRAVLTTARRPMLRAVRAFNLTLALFLACFALVYATMSHGDPGAFTSRLDRVDAMYFTVTVLATVGFGDIAPLGAASRIVVTVQMLLDLALLGAVVRLLAMAARTRLTRDGSAARDRR